MGYSEWRENRSNSFKALSEKVPIAREAMIDDQFLYSFFPKAGGRIGSTNVSTLVSSNTLFWTTQRHFTLERPPQRPSAPTGRSSVKAALKTRRVFFDTEFTDLGIDPKLISIGLVSEDGHAFYAELSEGWTIKECNEFVKLTVLPKLEGGAALLSMYALTMRLGDWLESFDAPVILATDSLAWDWPWIQEVFNEPGTWPENVRRHPLCLTMNSLTDWDAFVETREKCFSQGMRRHHALDDAKANRQGWFAGGGDSECGSN